MDKTIIHEEMLSAMKKYKAGRGKKFAFHSIRSFTEMTVEQIPEKDESYTDI